MSSPARKRMRLSSPTFDEQFGEPSQDDIDAFDCLDAQLSQSVVDPGRLRQPPSTAHDDLPTEDDDDPFRSDSRCTATNVSQTERIHASFVSATAIDRAIESPRLENVTSDEVELHDESPPEVDYAAWFSSDSSKCFAGFSTAMTGFQRPSINGKNTNAHFIPSAAALQEAEKKMNKWQEDVPLPDHTPAHKELDSPRSTHPVSPPHATFSSAKNAFSSVQIPETPTPASFPELTPVGLHNPSHSLGAKRRAKPFTSPLVTATPSILSHRQASTSNVNMPLRDHHSSATTPFQTIPVSPLRPSLAANRLITQQPLGFTPRHGSITTRPKFVTPFKAVVKSGTFTVEHREPPSTPSGPRTGVNRVYPPSSPAPRPSKRSSEGGIFDIAAPPGRQTLATCGLRPQAYSAKELEDLGINVKELGQVDPRTAPFYTFTTHPRSRPNLAPLCSSLALGRTAVLEELQTKGCALTTQAWVDNHWPLVLWKLAGMVALDPISENDPSRKRWCWSEVIRQLMYRYERDLNSSSRPPLRLITTKDASAESPMVLCISDIIWPASGSGEVIARPELEVTDGWYRLRAHIDAPLVRGIRKGKIKIGRKIAVVGAKLSAERKEGSEILAAYRSNVLLLTGNSTKMALWHAKLGFQHEPFVATLNSLTADGGNVAVMMLTVIKVHPVAYIEFVEDPDGQKKREGPRNAEEELKLCTQWKMKREAHASRLWSEYETRRSNLLDYAERLEQHAGSAFRPRHDDGPPDNIYDMYDTLREDFEVAGNIISSIGHEDAGWLARHIRERSFRERDEVSKEIEQELESVCPPRNIKTFCVIVANDTRTQKHPSKRVAQVTVWDVPGVSVLEGCTQCPFIPGQRYLAGFTGNQPDSHTGVGMDGSFLRRRRVFEYKKIF